MTRGSQIHDEVGDHFKRCTQCRAVDPERLRVQQSKAIRLTVPEATLAAMCLSGRHVYTAYLRWLAEPDE
jgi:hypothetical protein